MAAIAISDNESRRRAPGNPKRIGSAAGTKTIGTVLGCFAGELQDVVETMPRVARNKRSKPRSIYYLRLSEPRLWV